MFWDRGKIAENLWHSRFSRWPARHGSCCFRSADQRHKTDRKAAERMQSRDQRFRRGRHCHCKTADDAWAERRDPLWQNRRNLWRQRKPESIQSGDRQDLQQRLGKRHTGRRCLRHGYIYRRFRARRADGGYDQNHERKRHCACHGEPGAGDHAGRGKGSRRGYRGHGQIGFPEPDQQCCGVSRYLSRRAGR